MKQKLLLAISMICVSGMSQAVLIDRGGGMIYDDQLNITWLQDANYALSSGYAVAHAGGKEDSGSPSIIKIDGSMSWSSAMLWAENLEYGGYSDWRLPTDREDFSGAASTNEVFVASNDDFFNRRSYDYVASDLNHELGFMYYTNLDQLSGMGTYRGGLLAGTVVKLCKVEKNHPRCENNFPPFINLDRKHRYWSSKPYYSESGGYFFWFGLGQLREDYRGHTKMAWAVRSGDVTTTFEPDPKIALTDQLVAYYPFENNADDKSGHAHHGVEHGNVRYVSGAVGNGLKLDGMNSPNPRSNPDFIRVPNASSLQFSEQLTISYWVKIDGDKRQTSADCTGNQVDGVYGAVIGKSGDRSGWYLSEADSSSDFGINAFSGGHQQSVGGLARAFGKFRFVTYSISGNTVKLYIDGVLRSTQSGTINFESSNDKDLYIGIQSNSEENCAAKYWYPLDGVIDELRLYSRVISAAEIKALYKQRPNADQCNTLSATTCHSYKDVNLLLDWASEEYPTLFEKGRETVAIAGYFARYYPRLNIYLGSKDRKVYGYGALWNGLIYFGELDQFLSDQQLQ